MKTLKNIQTNEIRRVPDSRAEEMVDMGALGEKSGIFWTYVKKEVWKKEVRDVNMATPQPVVFDEAVESERLRKIADRKQKKEYQKQRRVRTNN